jgi:hypothetical protein
LRAESREQWIETLTALDRERCAKVGEAAFAQARRDFDSRLQALRLRALVDDIIVEAGRRPIETSSNARRPACSASMLAS